MSKIHPVALYQIETFGAGTRRQRPDERRPAQENLMKTSPAPARVAEFLVQLMVGGDPDLARRIGRRDVAARRENAYAEALANRPSARPLSFVTPLGRA